MYCRWLGKPGSHHSPTVGDVFLLAGDQENLLKITKHFILQRSPTIVIRLRRLSVTFENQASRRKFIQNKKSRKYYIRLNYRDNHMRQRASPVMIIHENHTSVCLVVKHCTLNHLNVCVYVYSGENFRDKS